MKEEPSILDLDLKSRPSLIQGGRHEDARGALRFCNDFDMTSVKRFYTISNSAEQPKRGWIMHKRETKWFFPVTGVTTIHVDPATDGRACDDGRGRSPSGPQQKYVLSAEQPAILCIPPNHWFLIDQSPELQSPPPPTFSTSSPEVMVFSNCHVGEFENDNFRKDIEA